MGDHIGIVGGHDLGWGGHCTPIIVFAEIGADQGGPGQMRREQWRADGGMRLCPRLTHCEARCTSTTTSPSCQTPDQDAIEFIHLLGDKRTIIGQLAHVSPFASHVRSISQRPGALVCSKKGRHKVIERRAEALQLELVTYPSLFLM